MVYALSASQFPPLSVGQNDWRKLELGFFLPQSWVGFVRKSKTLWPVFEMATFPPPLAENMRVL